MLNRVDENIEKFIKDLDDDRVIELYKNISSGKKLRAKLILKIADNNTDNAVVLASLVEMIHAASLLHDDVIDDANTRRGQKSINALFGDKTAIMFGDILYSKAFYELCNFSTVISQSISGAVSKLSVGELLDVELSKQFNSNVEKYFDMIYKKTASLIEAAAYSAAFLAGYDSDKFALYGKNLGLAFQVIDDILDITSDDKTLGKPSMNDYKEGKTTLPYIYLYKKLDSGEKQRLLSLFRQELNEKDKEWIKQKMETSGALKECFALVNKLGNEALKSIQEYKNSDLEKIIKDMIQREY